MSPVGRRQLGRWLGLGDPYEITRKMYRSRFGLIPLSEKAEKMKGLQDAKVLEIRGAALRGFLVTGRTEEKHVARIQLLDTVDELDLRLHFSSEAELDDLELGRIVMSVRSAASDRGNVKM